MNLNFVPGRNIRGIFGMFIMVVGAILSACGGGGGGGAGLRVASVEWVRCGVRTGLAACTVMCFSGDGCLHC